MYGIRDWHFKEGEYFGGLVDKKRKKKKGKKLMIKCSKKQKRITKSEDTPNPSLKK